MIKSLPACLFLATLLLMLALPTAQADRSERSERLTTGDLLLIEKVRERLSRDLPDNGLRMTAVEARFGAPVERRGPIGEPPITRWIYQDYSVYFEHDLVIESVLHEQAIVREITAQPR